MQPQAKAYVENPNPYEKIDQNPYYIYLIYNFS